MHVRAAGVRSYLLRRGWRLQAYPGPELFVFEGPTDEDGQTIIQVLPSSEEMRDFPLRAEELIAAVSILEDRSPQDVLTDILVETDSQFPSSSHAKGANGAVGTGETAKRTE